MVSITTNARLGRNTRQHHLESSLSILGTQEPLVIAAMPQGPDHIRRAVQACTIPRINQDWHTFRRQSTYGTAVWRRRCVSLPNLRTARPSSLPHAVPQRHF